VRRKPRPPPSLPVPIVTRRWPRSRLFSIVIDRDKGALPPIPESDAQLMHVPGLAEMDVVEVHPWRRRSTHTETAGIAT
jgi:hypothetical protein